MAFYKNYANYNRPANSPRNVKKLRIALFEKESEKGNKYYAGDIVIQGVKYTGYLVENDDKEKKHDFVIEVKGKKLPPSQATTW